MNPNQPIETKGETGGNCKSQIWGVVVRLAPLFVAVVTTCVLVRLKRFDLPTPTKWKLPVNTLELLAGTAALFGSLITMWLWQDKIRKNHFPVLGGMLLFIVIILAYNATVIVGAPPAEWTGFYDRYVEILFCSAYASFGFFCSYVVQLLIAPIREILNPQSHD